MAHPTQILRRFTHPTPQEAPHSTQSPMQYLNAQTHAMLLGISEWYKYKWYLQTLGMATCKNSCKWCSRWKWRFGGSMLLYFRDYKKHYVPVAFKFQGLETASFVAWNFCLWNETPWSGKHFKSSILTLGRLINMLPAPTSFTFLWKDSTQSNS